MNSPIRPGVDTDETLEGRGIPSDVLSGTSVNEIAGALTLTGGGGITITVDSETKTITLTVPNVAVRVLQPYRIAQRFTGWVLSGLQTIFGETGIVSRETMVDGDTVTTVFGVPEITPR